MANCTHSMEDKIGRSKNCLFKLDFFCYYLVPATTSVRDIKQHDDKNQLGGESRQLPENIIPPFCGYQNIGHAKEIFIFLPPRT